MKRTVHGGGDSSNWGKSKLANFSPAQAKPNMDKPDTVARAKGTVGGNSPLLSTEAKAGKLRKAI